MTAAYRSILLAASAVTSIIAQRIHDGIKPRNERLTCIVLKAVSDVPDYHFEGPSGFGPGRIQVECWAPTKAGAVALAAAAQTALENFTGVSAGISIGWIEVADKLDIDPIVEEGANVPTEYGVMFDAEYLRI